MHHLRNLTHNFLFGNGAAIIRSQIRLTSSSQPSEYINSNLHNGVGRYVCQLQRVTFKFCKEHASSRGIREFIEHDLVDFARNNPGVVVYLQPKRHRIPKISAEYCKIKLLI